MLDDIAESIIIAEFNCIYNSCFCFITSISYHHCCQAQAALVLGPSKNVH